MREVFAHCLLLSLFAIVIIIEQNFIRLNSLGCFAGCAPTGFSPFLFNLLQFSEQKL